MLPSTYHQSYKAEVITYSNAIDVFPTHCVPRYGYVVRLSNGGVPSDVVEMADDIEQR
jgi:hypothetical protein